MWPVRCCRDWIPLRVGTLGIVAISALRLFGAEVQETRGQLVLKAGVLQQTILLSGNRLQTRSWTIDGAEILASATYPPSRNFSLEISRANPDRRPAGISPGEAERTLTRHQDISRLVDEADVQDPRPGAVHWEDPIYLSGPILSAFAGKISYQVSRPGPDLVQLTVSVPLVRPEMLKGVEIVLRLSNL